MQAIAAETKQCNRCGQRKPVDSFHRNKNMSDGRLNQCKECLPPRSPCRRPKTKEQLAYNAAFMRRWRRQNKEGSQAITARYYAKCPEKKRAHAAVARAVAAGRLKALPCEVCGELPTEAHHDDYDKPLEVRWLCHIHHKAVHAKADDLLRME